MYNDLRKQMIENAKKGIKEAYESEEYSLIQAINAMSELVKSSNLANERLSEWDGLYAPSAKVDSNQAIELAMQICSGSYLDKSGIGRKPEAEEAKSLKAFADMARKMHETIDILDAYVKEAAKRLMPNSSYLIGENLSAELLSKAGSLKALATMPASTIQLLGAEKALFKHIKFGTKSPKYGLLFKLPEIATAKKWQEGKIARAYAAKLAIAFRADYFSKNFIAENLKSQLSTSLAKIMASKQPEKHVFKHAQKSMQKKAYIQSSGRRKHK
ncbi:MAG: hypothetical protein QW045_00950 [Candidatus Micrarchaeaceae archaeon]